MTSPYSFLQLMSHIYGIVPYYLEPGEAFPLPTTTALLSPGSIPLRGMAASQSIPVYRSTPAFGVLRTVYLYSTIAPHVVLLGIVFWMAGEAELSTEISSSVDGLSYSAFALCSFAATYCTGVHTTHIVGEQHHGIYATIIQSQVHTVDRLQSQ